MAELTTVRHGGDIRAAARRYGIPEEAWLDLSTGINPEPWPMPEPPRATWARLPEEGDGLEAEAGAYYGTGELLPVPGSQAALQWLPRWFRAPRRVGVATPGYAEHRHAWERAGHTVVPVPPEGPESVAGLDVLVVIQPSNPVGVTIPVEKLQEWRTALAVRNGWLVVDEAFADAGSVDSLASEAGTPGLIVLRSLGKFFGLAGLRVGFCLGPADVRSALSEALGPWAVSGPGRWAARHALADVDWQAATRRRLVAEAARLDALLAGHGLEPSGESPLFRWVPTPRAAALEEGLARRGIRVRRFDEPAALRFGLPGAEDQWHWLEEALSAITKEETR
ncbi:MAG: threonine-phosphate decarboxylase CobD [Pseudomonadota bacterium]